MRALYESGEQSQLRLLLNQDETNTLTRNIQYSEYIFAARQEKMQSYIDAIKRLGELEQQARDAIAELQATQATLETEQAQLIAQQEERKQIASSADAELEAKGSALETLERDRKSLQKLVDQIEKQRALDLAREEKRKQDEALRAQQEQERLLAYQEQQAQLQAQAAEQKAQENQPAETPTAKPEPAARPEKKSAPAYSAEDLAKLQSKNFLQRKGNLAWPVQGKLTENFGAQRQGSVTWDGLRIQAPSGSEVRAIHSGRVMYADSLPGQGLLMVLDHGDGFMSLYAHNDVLLHEAGEWVQPGDTIARVGNSGGEKEPGLYFEIRKNGQPINPMPWLAKR